MSRIISICLLLLSTSLFSQSDFSIFQYRSVGPMRGGRVTAVSGTAVEPGTFYMGATGGGVWKTTDYGLSWSNVSDGYFETPSIGDIAVATGDPNIVYVGTGSDGVRSNVIAGRGVYKSIDGGSTWEHVGLKNAGQIGAVEVHPRNPNVAYVAAIGNVFAPNAERGLYKTEDGGETWQNVLFISDKVGIADVELLPGNPNVLFATAWKVDRKPWTIESGGSQQEGGLYKSVNGGKSWKKVTNGLPQGLIGKIDLAVSAADSKVVYALVEAPGDQGGLYRSDNQGKSFEQVSSEGGIRTRPFYYTNVEADPQNPDVVYVMATGYFKSTDGGKNWSRLRPPHGDNHDMWINPENPNLFIQANDGGANVTFNGGETWTSQFNQPTSELYQVEVDDQYPYWLYAGQQDNYSTVAVPSMASHGIQNGQSGWIINTGGCETGPAVPKPGDHNIVYSNCKGRFSVFDKRTGLDRRYDVGAANMYGHNPKDLKFRFQRVAPIHVSPHDPGVIYHTSQYVHKTTDEGKTWEIISPDLTAFEADKQVISGSPITRDITGEEFYSTIYAIRESTLEKGQIWVGANDGPVHVTRDGGASWSKVTPAKMPTGGRVDAVEPSKHTNGKAYISVLRYQLGDPKPYIYKTTDFGKKWTLITEGIPSDYPVRVVREDPNREGLLYAGTEYGMFISFDDGASWEPFQQNLPVTPITDIKMHRGDLVASTMGRGFWVLDNLSALSQAEFGSEKNAFFKPEKTIRYQYPKTSNDLYPRPSMMFDYQLTTDISAPIKLEIFKSNGDLVNVFLSQKPQEDEVIENMNLSDVIYLVDESLGSKKGLNRFRWNMRHQGAWSKNEKRAYRNGVRVSSGKYRAVLTVNGQKMEQEFELVTDPRILSSGISDEDIQKKEELGLQVTKMLTEARMLMNSLEEEVEEAEGERKTKIDEALAILRTEEGTYPQPKLVEQIGYLYYTVNGPDQLPGKDVYDRYNELRSELDELTAISQ